MDNSLGSITPLNHKKIFTLEEAQQVLPLVYSVTDKAQKEVKHLMNKMEAIKNVSGQRASEVETEINTIVERWQHKMQRLGASPKGLWLADFDNGKGYYCWKFPETQIGFWHGYNDGFSGRISVLSQ
jgi:hypothetical protein